MEDLRLIGVHEDGEHLLLTDSAGTRYRLALDEQLRAAARRDRPRLGQLQIEIQGGLRPREVQALVRRGMSAEEVAARAGWTVEKVQRFEGPILAEREHIADQVRATRLDAQAGAQGGASTTLGARVQTRLEERGVDAQVASWDSSRSDDGSWRVTVVFPAGGRERTATWRWDPLVGIPVPHNDEARWLSEDDSAGPLTPHVATTATRVESVFDVESDGQPRGRESVDLAESMRESSRGRRRRRGPASPTHIPHAGAPREDALPLEPLAGEAGAAGEPPVARGYHPVEAHLDEQADATDRDRPAERLPTRRPVVGSERSRRAEAPATTVPDPDGASGSVDAPAEPTTAIPVPGDTVVDLAPVASGSGSTSGASTVRESTVPESADAEHTGTEPATPADESRAGRRRRGRKSVPSWDDIMFGGGSRGDDG